MPDESGVEDAGPGATLRYKPLGEILVHMRWLKAEQIEQAVKASRAHGEKLGKYLVHNGVISSDALCRALALQSGLPVTDLTARDIPADLGQLFGWELMSKYGFVPFDQSETFVCVAAQSPLKPAAILELENICHKNVEVYLAPEDGVAGLLEHYRQRRHESRRSIRYEVRLPVRYQFCNRLGEPAEQAIHDGVTLGLSENRIQLEGPPTALDTPDNLRRRGLCLTVWLTHGAQAISTLCQIHSIRPQSAADAERWLYSLAIVDATEADRRRLKELRVQMLLERKKKP